MTNYRVSLAFANIPDNDLITFAATNIASLSGNPAFPTLPVTLATLEDQETTFSEAVVAAQDGGSLALATRNAAREILLGTLRKIAAYVQTVAGTDLEKLLSSGFQPTSSNRTQTALPAPAILTIDNPASGQLSFTVKPIANARAYEIRYSIQPNVWIHGETYPNSRNLLLGNLTPGSNYTIQIRVIGGSELRSPWSEPVTHMAT